MNLNLKLLISLFIFNLIINVNILRTKKNVADFSDADFERLYEEWEENDVDKSDEDELPLYKRQQDKLDLNLLNQNPNLDLQSTNIGQAVMVFVRLNGNPTKVETEDITALWQTSLFNANYDVTRYIVEVDKAIFMVKDGSLASEIKDYLIKQDRCLEVTIENERYEGLYNKKEFFKKTRDDL